MNSNVPKFVATICLLDKTFLAVRLPISLHQIVQIGDIFCASFTHINVFLLPQFIAIIVMEKYIELIDIETTYMRKIGWGSISTSTRLYLLSFVGRLCKLFPTQYTHIQRVVRSHFFSFFGPGFVHLGFTKEI